jgi:hypothetical protein
MTSTPRTSEVFARLRGTVSDDLLDVAREAARTSNDARRAACRAWLAKQASENMAEKLYQEALDELAQ